MSSAVLTINHTALAANWRALNAISGGKAAAVVKADGYGLGAADVAHTLAKAGARQFFVAVAEEGVAVRAALGPGPRIGVFSGHMDGNTALLRDHDLTPMLNSVDQMLRHMEALPRHPFGIQLDTGMNRLGMEPAEWSAVCEIALSQNPVLVMSHLACADTPAHPMNMQQLQTFIEMTTGLGLPRSLAATGGTLLGAKYHFDLTRPGIGMYGGQPYVNAQPVVTLEAPVIQIRDLQPGESVGYGNAWTAQRDSKVATLSVGYADGILRAMGGRTQVYDADTPCPIIGRISMDLITVDVTDLPNPPAAMSLLNAHQGVDDLATAAGTIGYEILTSLGARYTRVHHR